MALTEAYDVGTVGAGRTAPVFANSKKPLKFVTGTIAFDTSYPTGGESFTSIGDKFAGGVPQGIIFESKGGYTFSYDYTNEKVIAYWVDTTVDGAAQAQVANTTDLSSITGVRFLAWGLPGAGATS